MDKNTMSEDVKKNGEAMVALARKLYLHYCKEKAFNPRQYPWSPLWAMEYAQIAVDAYGFDDEGYEDLLKEITQ